MPPGGVHPIAYPRQGADAGEVVFGRTDTNPDPISEDSSLAAASRSMGDWQPFTQQTCFSKAGRKSYTAKELSEAAASFHQPTISAFRASWIAGTARAPSLLGSSCAARQGCRAGLTSRQNVSAVLDMFTAVPDALILPGYSKEPPAAFTGDMGFWLRSRQNGHAVGRILFQLGYEGRRPRIRSKDRQSVACPSHRNIHDAPLFGVLERFLFRRH